MKEKSARDATISCATCKGPLRTDCLSCDSTTRDFSTITGRCTCKSGNPYLISGVCSPSCSSGQAAYHPNSYCLDTCPPYRFHYVDFATTDSIYKTTEQSATSGTDFLQFSTSPTACLELPGPTGATSLPNEFTLSLWVKITSTLPSSDKNTYLGI